METLSLLVAFAGNSPATGVFYRKPVVLWFDIFFVVDTKKVFKTLPIISDAFMLLSSCIGEKLNSKATFLFMKMVSDRSHKASRRWELD